MKYFALLYLVMAQIVVLSKGAASEETQPTLGDISPTLLILSCNTSAFSTSPPLTFAPLQIKVSNLSYFSIQFMTLQDKQKLEKTLNVFPLFEIPKGKICNCCRVILVFNNTQPLFPIIFSMQNLTTSLHMHRLGNTEKEQIKKTEFKISNFNCSASSFQFTSFKMLKNYLTKYFLNSSGHKRWHSGKSILFQLHRAFDRLKLCQIIHIKISDALSPVIHLKGKKRLTRDANRQVSNFQDHGELDRRIVTKNSSSFYNSTAYLIELFKKEQMKKQLEMEAESAALCLVFISCLMLFCIWYLRGFHNRNTKYREVTFHDNSHILTVKEVLFRKRHYLPMFKRDDGLEEVFVHDCGNDP